MASGSDVSTGSSTRTHSRTRSMLAPASPQHDCRMGIIRCKMAIDQGAGPDDGPPRSRNDATIQKQTKELPILSAAFLMKILRIAAVTCLAPASAPLAHRIARQAALDAKHA